ncbi:unnamed protein product, partial [Adineta steineri]
IEKLILDLNGKLTGMFFYVPTANVSIIDLTARLNKDIKYDNMCTAIKKATDSPIKCILAYTDDEVFSIDFISDTHSVSFYIKALNFLICS